MNKEEIEKIIKENIETLKLRIKISHDHATELEKQFTWEDVLYFKKNELDYLLFQINENTKEEK